MEVMVGKTKLSILQGDITQQAVEAIVNAANSSLMGGGGVDGAIHRAGGPQILAECKEIVNKQGKLPTGEAVITGGGNLPAAYVIHTVGPIWQGGSKEEPLLLRNAYFNSLQLAKEKGIKTLAFPSISTGAYGYPLEQAARVALNTLLEYLKEHDCFQEVRMVLFNSEICKVYEKVCSELV